MENRFVKALLLLRYKALWGGIAIFSLSYFVIGYFLYGNLIRTGVEVTNGKNMRELPFGNKFLSKNFSLDAEQSIILMWSHPWCVSTEGIQEGSVVGECLFTYDKEKVQEAHAIVFHHTTFTCSHVPQPWIYSRHPDQIFVWYSMENPANLRQLEPHAFDRISENFINWTMSYRTDADVFYPYVDSETLTSAARAGSSYVDSIISKKRRVALWVVRNCNKSKAAQDRWRYVEELIEAGLPVDRYGKCFNNSDKYAELLRQPEKFNSYKFYLAFENGHGCRDYITEKFWDNSLLSGRLPVVWGPKKKDVIGLVPPGSFLHTDDFKSPRDLAAYLLYLNRSATAYRRYFAWMEKPSVFETNFKNLYSQTREELLCKKIRENTDYKSITNLRKYLFTNDRKACFT